MVQFTSQSSLSDFQSFIHDIYSLTDDRLFSLEDLLANQNKYTMRMLKGIRKEDTNKIKHNVLISFSWCMSVATRLHIDIEDAVWKRYPTVCLYCGGAPCTCGHTKPDTLAHINFDTLQIPRGMQGFQEMFEKIYPASTKTLTDVGVHMGEEMGEIMEAVSNYFGQHSKERFTEIEYEIADYISHIFGVANLLGLNLAQELMEMYKNGCHDCGKLPCNCSYLDVIDYKS